MNSRSVRDVCVDRVREWRGLLEYDADTSPQLRHVLLTVVNIVPIESNHPVDPCGRDRVIHAIEAAQKGGFAAARRPDHGEHLITANVETDVFDGVLVAVINIHATRRHQGIAHDIANGYDGVGLGDRRFVHQFVQLSRSAR